MDATAALLLLTLLSGSDSLPLVPPGPTAGDLGAGWAAELAAIEPRADARVPWLRSATSARLFVHRLPQDPQAARPRLVEAAAMILARHGRSFEHPAWDEWFRSQAWYEPGQDYAPGLLSEGEREALGLLTEAWERLTPGGPTKR